MQSNCPWSLTLNLYPGRTVWRSPRSRTLHRTNPSCRWTIPPPVSWRAPSSWGRREISSYNISSPLISPLDLHLAEAQPPSAATAIRGERSDHTLGSVGISTVLRSIAHRTQSGIGTGLRHLAFHQSDTIRHRYFVVFVESGESVSSILFRVE